MVVAEHLRQHYYLFFAIKAKKSHRLILTQNEFRSKFKSENYRSSGRTSENIFLP